MIQYQKLNRLAEKALLLLIVLSFIPFFSGCDWFRKKTGRSRISKTPSRKVTYHYVKPGETLWNIAKHYHVDLDSLIAANSISNPKNIQVGQRLYIPVTGQVRNPDKAPVKVPRKPEPPRPVPGKTKTPSAPDNSDKDYLKYRGIFVFPLQKGQITRKFNDTSDIFADGIDIVCKEAQPVRAIADGMIEYVGSDMEGFGTTAIISHPDDYYSLYAFISEPKIEIGQQVKKNEPIASTGRTGSEKRLYTLHFQLRKGILPQDPMKYYDSEVKSRFR